MAFVQINLYSNKIGRSANINVIIPEKKYSDLSERKSVPVLYLLHGAAGDEYSFTRYTSIERYADKHGLAVVMPGCENSDYTNMSHGQGYYDYVAKELPEIMYSFFGLSPDRDNCYIAGVSMGANGALKIGLANPDRYSVIGCISGAMTYRMPPKDTSSIDPEEDKYMFLNYDGKTIEGTEDDMEGNARRIAEGGGPAPVIYHTIGASDFIFDYAKETKKFFASFANDPFRYRFSVDDGKHDWDFWDRALEKFIEFIFSGRNDDVD